MTENIVVQENPAPENKVPDFFRNGLLKRTCTECGENKAEFVEFVDENNLRCRKCHSAIPRSRRIREYIAISDVPMGPDAPAANPVAETSPLERAKKFQLPGDDGVWVYTDDNFEIITPISPKFAEGISLAMAVRLAGDAVMDIRVKGTNAEGFTEIVVNEGDAKWAVVVKVESLSKVSVNRLASYFEDGAAKS